ncbi:phage head morphogenesis protein [uncultured Mediterranean phage uvMED]|nr:putative head morphogenesis protein [uncultured Mediterranean phage uvMED]BAQ93599.1 phage head morphogenesis protein [uncultured Mediterranean phage uvMED]BAR24997.1 phage head morphogenesis protein [uncultured Mediterranean phage uvMED]BAR25047.1 phage head morphogenesis protein [uncultured Mediterranean phage uvMED]BAR25091.1 phage head morphogenesis protein [uncultured Mediterranean phage uvMED]
MTTPAELYKNAIDLNRFSNSVARRIVRTYNDLIVDAIERLAATGADPTATQAARLRAILAQLKGSLDGWAGTATALSVEELQGLVELQTRFVTNVLDGELPDDLLLQVRSVQISPQFAQAVATIDPTTYNIVTLSDDLGAAVTGTPRPFELEIGDGTTITLPNGATLQKSFSRLAGQQAEVFTKEVRNGLILGESSDKIARRLRRQLIAVPNNQIRTMVRTSVNQVANAASQAVYSQNQEITKRYRYIATLDSRTSAICRALDGRTFKYNEGPTPPQHFNCRSTTVPIVDYKGLGIPPPEPGKRRSSGGLVPADQTYGQWLSEQSAEVKNDVLGASKVPYFNMLSQKYGPSAAIRKFVSTDGTEKTLAELKQSYDRFM